MESKRSLKKSIAKQKGLEQQVIDLRKHIQDLRSKKSQENINPTKFMNQVDLIRSLEEAQASDFKMDAFKGKKMSKNEVANYVKLFSPAQQFNQPGYNDQSNEQPKNRPINRYHRPNQSLSQPMPPVETEEFIETTSNSENWVCIFTNFWDVI